MLKLYILSMIICPPTYGGDMCVKLVDNYNPQRTMQACLNYATHTTRQLVLDGYIVKAWTCDEKVIR